MKNSTYVYPFTHVSHELKSQVWWKGTPIDGFDTKEWMRDKCGRAMRWADHGNRDSEYGWEIDHIVPTAKGGGDELSNLQPLNWENNAKKGDTYPWSCGQ